MPDRPPLRSTTKSEGRAGSRRRLFSPQTTSLLHCSLSFKKKKQKKRRAASLNPRSKLSALLTTMRFALLFLALCVAVLASMVRENQRGSNMRHLFSIAAAPCLSLSPMSSPPPPPRALSLATGRPLAGDFSPRRRAEFSSSRPPLGGQGLRGSWRGTNAGPGGAETGDSRAKLLKKKFRRALQIVLSLDRTEIPSTLTHPFFPLSHPNSLKLHAIASSQASAQVRNSSTFRKQRP